MSVHKVNFIQIYLTSGAKKLFKNYICFTLKKPFNLKLSLVKLMYYIPIVSINIKFMEVNKYILIKKFN